MSILGVSNIETRFGKQFVHTGTTFSITDRSGVAIIGSSGCGKSTLLREIIGLLKPTSGSISLMGTDVWRSNRQKLDELRRRFGVLFQNGALFSALTCGENIATPMVEQMNIPAELLPYLVQLRLGLTGLPPDTALKMPSEL